MIEPPNIPVCGRHVLHTNMDHNPEIERFNGRLRLVFTRASGTTNDGICYTKEI